jgi:hypothetical protein
MQKGRINSMETDDDKVDSIKNPNNLDPNNFSLEVKEAARQFLEEIKNNASDTLQENNKKIEDFKRRINNFWKKPLDLLDLLLIYSLQMGSKFNNEMRATAEKENDYVFLVLTRLHAKGCLVGQEIATLMKHGYASGAHARWRSLHEIAITACT